MTAGDIVAFVILMLVLVGGAVAVGYFLSDKLLRGRIESETLGVPRQYAVGRFDQLTGTPLGTGKLRRGGILYRVRFQVAGDHLLLSQVLPGRTTRYLMSSAGWSIPLVDVSAHSSEDGKTVTLHFGESSVTVVQYLGLPVETAIAGGQAAVDEAAISSPLEQASAQVAEPWVRLAGRSLVIPVSSVLVGCVLSLAAGLPLLAVGLALGSLLMLKPMSRAIVVGKRAARPGRPKPTRGEMAAITTRIVLSGVPNLIIGVICLTIGLTYHWLLPLGGLFLAIAMFTFSAYGSVWRALRLNHPGPASTTQ